MRADVSGTLGWLVVNREVPAGYDFGDDWQHSLFAAATAGWYWTDHLKTELELGAGTETTAYRSRRIVIDGRPTSEFVESRYVRRRVGLGQHYQFFRNAWFHPYVAAGANVSFDDITDRTHAVVTYGPAPGNTRVIEPERIDRRSTVVVSPFVSAGFKAYLTERGFFRSALEVTLRDGVDEVLLRFGFGMDF